MNLLNIILNESIQKKRVHTVVYYLYKVYKQAKLIFGDRSHDGLSLG